MIQADSVLSTPRTDSSPFHRMAEQARLATPERADDELGMAWWNGLCEQDRRHWMRIAGDTGRAVDAWQTYKRLRMAERDPRDIIAEILEEHLVPDTRAVADAIVEHLRDAGFEIKPIDYPKRRR